MYVKGMSTGDIEAHIQDIYGISASDSTVSRVTDKNPAHRQRVVATTSGVHLRCGISGCHPLPCAQRMTVREENSVYCHWCQSG